MSDLKLLKEKAKQYKIYGCGKMKKEDLEYAINQYEGCGYYIGNCSTKEIRDFAKSIGIKDVKHKKKQQLLEEIKETNVGGSMFRRFFNLIGKSTKAVVKSAPIQKALSMSKKIPIVKNVVNFLDYRKDFKKGTKETLEKFGNIPIKAIMINRCPIQSWINKTLDVLSFGYFTKQVKERGFDKLFHLSMIFTLENGIKIVVEKNEEINVSVKLDDCPTGDSERLLLPQGFNKTTNQMLQQTLDTIGEKKFYDYDAFEFNCARFIKDILESNGLMTQETLNFVYQDLDDLYADLKQDVAYLTPIMKGFTRMGALKNKITGQGVERIGERGFEDLSNREKYFAYWLMKIAKDKKGLYKYREEEKDKIKEIEKNTKGDKIKDMIYRKDYNPKEMDKISKDLIFKAIPKRHHKALGEKLLKDFKMNWNKSRQYFTPNPLLNKKRKPTFKSGEKEIYLPMDLELEKSPFANEGMEKGKKFIIHDDGHINYKNGKTAGLTMVYKGRPYAVFIWTHYNERNSNFKDEYIRVYSLLGERYMKRNEDVNKLIKEGTIYKGENDIGEDILKTKVGRLNETDRKRKYERKDKTFYYKKEDLEEMRKPKQISTEKYREKIDKVYEKYGEPLEKWKKLLFELNNKDDDMPMSQRIELNKKILKKMDDLKSSKGMKKLRELLDKVSTSFNYPKEPDLFNNFYGFKRGGGIPNEALIFESVKSSYQPKAKEIGNGFELILDSDTMDAWVRESDKTILIGIRGTRTSDNDDLKADATLIFNGLKYTTRYANDKEKMEDLMKTYPPSEYDYTLGGHSLSGAIINQFRREYPHIDWSVAYNSAFQTGDLTNQQHDDNIKRYYMDSDFLYNLGGRFFKNAIVIPYKEEQAKSFFGRLKKMLPSSKVKRGLSAHNLDNFNKLYSQYLNEMKNREKNENIQVKEIGDLTAFS